MAKIMLALYAAGFLISFVLASVSWYAVCKDEDAYWRSVYADEGEEYKPNRAKDILYGALLVTTASVLWVLIWLFLLSMLAYCKFIDYINGQR